MKNKRAILFLSIGLIIASSYIYSEPQPWYTRFITFVQTSVWNPFVDIFRRLLGMDKKDATTIRAIVDVVSHDQERDIPQSPLPFVDYVRGGKATDISDAIVVLEGKKYALAGIFDGNAEAARIASDHLKRFSTPTATKEGIEIFFEKIEKKLIADPELGQSGTSVTGFVASENRICIFSIGSSKAMLFHRGKNIHDTSQHLLSIESEIERLKVIATQAGKPREPLIGKTLGIIGQPSTKYGLLEKAGTYTIDGLPLSRFLGYRGKKNSFGPRVQTALSTPDIWCKILSPGTYYIVLATKDAVDTLSTKAIQEALKVLTVFGDTIAITRALDAIEVESPDTVKGKFILVRLIIKS